MRLLPAFALVFLAWSVAVAPQTSTIVPLPSAEDLRYELGPDSRPRPGVPHGERFSFTFANSRLFPGTSRTIEVYVPAQYRPSRPACVYVAFDAFRFEEPTVFDNLIASGEMPVTIAIAVAPGRVEAARTDDPRYDRSVEFDSLDDRLARFLTEELFSEIERHRTADGRPLRLSHDPNDRAAGGGSTGAAAAFTLAWQRPDLFRRVFSAVGTYVGMRGGDSYPVLIRKTEPRPLRIFLQDGSNDRGTSMTSEGVRGFAEMGNWWLKNVEMEDALSFAGYDVNHVWGDGSHNPRHAAAIFPAAMRWLWRDWPRPLRPGHSQNAFLAAIVAGGSEWEPEVAPAPLSAIATIPGPMLAASSRTRAWRLDGAGLWQPGAPAFAALAYPAETIRFALAPGGELRHGERRLAGVSAIAAAPGGAVYVVTTAGTLQHVDAAGRVRELDVSLRPPLTLAVSPDAAWLAAIEVGGRGGYSYRIAPDGSLSARRFFYWLHEAGDDPGSGAGQLAVDREGRLYAATRLGIQVIDRNGRVRAILPVPCGETVGVAFAASDFGRLHALCRDGRLFGRTMRVPGYPGWAPPVALPPNGAG